MNDETVGFDTETELVAYLLSGVLSPYLLEASPDRRQWVAERVADRLGELAIHSSA